MEDFARLLERLDVASGGQMLGCSTEEVGLVKALDRDGILPDSYLAFLKRFGRGAGRLFRGTDIYFPRALEINGQAKEFAEDDDLSVTARFFFAEHQGYQWYFLSVKMKAYFCIRKEKEIQSAWRTALLNFFGMLREQRLLARRLVGKSRRRPRPDSLSRLASAILGGCLLQSQTSSATHAIAQQTPRPARHCLGTAAA